jgi:hypothetical protein
LEGNWIVSYAWIEACWLARKWVAEKDFEILGETRHPFTYGPYKGRERERMNSTKVFEGMRFSFQADPISRPVLAIREIRLLMCKGGAKFDGIFKLGQTTDATDDPDDAMHAADAAPSVEAKGVTPPRDAVSLASQSSTPATVNGRGNEHTAVKLEIIPPVEASEKPLAPKGLLLCDPQCSFEEASALGRESGLIPVSFVWALDCVSRFDRIDYNDPRFFYRLDRPRTVSEDCSTRE